MAAGALWRGAIIGLVAVAMLAAIGCGGERTDQLAQGPASHGAAHGETIHDCLLGTGFTYVVAPQELGFYREARRANDVVQIGSAYDKRDDVNVHVLAPKDGGAKKWMLLYSQPASASRNISEIAGLWAHWYSLGPDDPRKSNSDYLHRSYVIFKLDPDLSLRKRIHRCVKFPLSAG